MELLPPEVIQINHRKIQEIDDIVRAIYRLIIYSRYHSDDDLLDSYQKGILSLRELLSLKNAQMEAQTKEEAAEYLIHFTLALEFVLEEIVSQNNFEKELQLFQLLKIASPEAYAIHPNKYRQTLVQIGAHICPDANQIPMLVNNLMYQMEKISNPIIKAIYFHHELIRIHPFVDGNGRVTRLAKNWLLMYELYPPTFITDVSEKKIYVDSLANSFRALDLRPNVWNDYTAIFFEKELDNLLTNIEYLHETIKRIGTKREEKAEN